MNKEAAAAALTAAFFIGAMVHAEQSVKRYTVGKSKQAETVEYDVCSEKALETYKYVQVVRTGEGEGEGETLKYKISVYEIMKNWCANRLQK